jgi:large subunit ribosomal protein L17
MEHRKKGRKLKRTASHRKALLSNLSSSLIKHKRIITTLAKAKELRTVIEPLLTKAKNAYNYSEKSPEKSVHLRREARKVVKEKDALNILFGEVAEKILDRNGGYTRILKLGTRYGDGGEKALIELVDYDVMEEAKAKEKSKSKSTKGGKKEEKVSEPEVKKSTEKKDKKSAEKKEKKPVIKETVKKEKAKEEKPEKKATKKTVKDKKETVAKKETPKKTVRKKKDSE